MSDEKNKKLEQIWRRIGLAFLILAIVIVAGPQIIDLVFPDFR